MSFHSYWLLVTEQEEKWGTTILLIIFWNFTIFQYRSGSPQVKRNLISSIAHLVYELPYELPNNLGLRILGNIIQSLHASEDYNKIRYNNWRGSSVTAANNLLHRLKGVAPFYRLSLSWFPTSNQRDSNNLGAHWDIPFH